MGKIGLVTDSSAYLPRPFKEQFQVEVVSLTVNFQGKSQAEESLYDQMDDFYLRLAQAPSLPTTSQPSVGDFLQVYQKLADNGAEAIISLHLSGGISGTVKTAQAAARMLPGLDITVIDTVSAAIGEYLVVEAAARAIAAGLDKERVVACARYVTANMSLIYLPGTLDYLRKGGRIGGAAALLGNILQIRPLLFFNPEKNGIIDLYDKVRTKEKGLQRMLAEMEKQTPPLKTIVGYVGDRSEGLNLLERVKSLHPEYNPEICPVGAVIGTHIGPGTVGLGFYPLTPELRQFIPN